MRDIDSGFHVKRCPNAKGQNLNVPCPMSHILTAFVDSSFSSIILSVYNGNLMSLAVPLVYPVRTLFAPCLGQIWTKNALFNRWCHTFDLRCPTTNFLHFRDIGTHELSSEPSSSRTLYQDFFRFRLCLGSFGFRLSSLQFRSFVFLDSHLIVFGFYLCSDLG